MYRLNHYGLLADAVQKQSSSSNGMILATSLGPPKMTKEKLWAGKTIDAPLCKYRKGFFDHLKPRAFIMSVSGKYPYH